MALIRSGSTPEVLSIDPLSGAARVSFYDNLGNHRGVKATYRAAFSQALTLAAGTGIFILIEGSATKTVIVQTLSISGMSLNTLAYNTVVAGKYSSAASGGTVGEILRRVPADTLSPASTVNTCQYYSAAPTAGTLVGVVAARRYLLQATTAAASGVPDYIEFDFRTKGSENTGIYLRGVAEGLGLSFGAAPATGVLACCDVQWTEE